MSVPKYFLFGPPGTRKSTLVRVIPRLTSAAYAVDLERVGPDVQARRLFAETVAKFQIHVPIFVGSADVWPPPKGFRVLRLWPPTLEKYLEYVGGRNSRFPHKAGQNEPHHYGNMSRLDESLFYRTYDPTRLDHHTDESFTRFVLEDLQIPFEP